MPPVGIHLLLVEDNKADTILVRAKLQDKIPTIQITNVDSLKAAEEALNFEVFDIVLCDHMLPDGLGTDFLDYVQAEGFELPFVLLTGTGRESLAVDAMKKGAYDFVRKENDQSHLDQLPFKLQEAIRQHQRKEQNRTLAMQEEQSRMLSTIRSTVATVNHEINNPLAIISGNAQYLLELCKTIEVDSEMVKSVSDIEEASRRIAESLRKLGGIKKIITRDYVTGQSKMLDIHDEKDIAS